MCDAMRDRAGGETFGAKDAIRPATGMLSAHGGASLHGMLDFIPFDAEVRPCLSCRWVCRVAGRVTR